MKLLIILFIVVFCRAEEDEAVLKRLNKMETEINKLTTGMKKLASENIIFKAENKYLQEVNQNMLRKMKNLEDLMSSNLNDTTLSKRVTVINPVNVAFHANMVGLKSLHDNEVLHFDKVNTNLGNSYDEHLGVFQSPTPGFYVFFVHFLTIAPKSIEAHIVRNGDIIQNVYAGIMGRTDAGYAPGSNMAIVQLKQGDRVWIRVHDHYHDIVDVLDGPWCTFAGYLLYPEI
ncbi:caprin-2 [Mytilus galloprovincialis]|uniref:Caprin-2 n=1 Tax=Mytilus galloprovincialis TaxID=29158 RepID=A0A8B6FEF1_MYTGA|nr:caprin-2 [Mytilus galloprovincialis]